ncbi:MAG: YtxH domain-containing protein [Clostridiaceae bacterium]|jgi:gas vesicle protein|nr:YtxH domain-containing protein [Clostridiaceae bacterium]
MIQEIRDALNGTYERRARNNAVAGLTTGLVIGALAGILLAPKSGKETRADIREGAKIGAEKVKETAHHLGDIAKEKVELAKEKVAEVKEHIKTGRHAAEAAAEAVEEVVEEAVEEARAT